MSYTIKIVAGVVLLSGVTLSAQINKVEKKVILKAKKDGIVDERIFTERDITKESGIVDSNVNLPGEINEENKMAAEEDAKLFKKKTFNNDEKIDKKNKKVEKELSSELDLKTNFIEEASKGYEKRRVYDEVVEELSEVDKKVKKIVPIEEKKEKLIEAEAFTFGNGEKEFFVFFDTGDKKSVELIKKYTGGLSKNIKLHIIITNKIFDLDSAKKTTWILLGKNNEERRERAKKIFKENSSRYKWTFIYRNIFGIQDGIDEVLSKLDKAEAARKILNVSEVPAIYDSKLIKRDFSILHLKNIK